MPNSAKQYKVRVAASGFTASDGRLIEPNWITEMASAYDPQVYGARINIEHIKSLSANSQFGAYGDVHALEAVHEVIGGIGRQCLYATIEPTEELIEINQRKQKIYTSVEIQPNFAETGKPYLVGLAVTDEPASLCTEALKFKSGRKLSENNVFSAGYETHLDPLQGSDQKNSQGIENASIETLRAELAKKEATFSKTSNDGKAIDQNMMPSITQFSEKFLAQNTAILSALTGVTETVSKLSTQIDTLANTPAGDVHNDYRHDGSSPDSKSEY